MTTTRLTKAQEKILLLAIQSYREVLATEANPVARAEIGRMIEAKLTVLNRGTW